MNIGPIAVTLNKANGTPRKLSRPDYRSHFPQPYVCVRDHDPLACLQRSERIAGHHCVGIGDTRSLESINAIRYKMLIGFKMHKAIRQRQVRGQRALPATRKSTQNHATEPGKFRYMN